MNRCPSIEQLRQLLADALPGPDAQDVEAHATTCANCQQALERLAAGDSVPRQATPPPADASHDEAFLRQLEAAPPWAGSTSHYDSSASSDSLDSEVPCSNRPRTAVSGGHDEAAPTPQVPGYE